MKEKIPTKANVLGDLRAEYDHSMLENAFYESPDYRSIIESGDRAVIVGRRGAGKSALFYRLKKHWSSAAHTAVITVAPEDFETIGLQAILNPFKMRLSLVRAVAKLSWRYALILEIASALKSIYKFPQIAGVDTLRSHLADWSRGSETVTGKMARKVRPLIIENQQPEMLVGQLPGKLEISALSEEISTCLNELNISIFILIDRLDEGYEANEVGVGLIDGFLHATIEINRALPKVKAFIFLRDNIFRTIAKFDPDFSRQIEGQVIRLHWDEYHLLNLIANRFRAAFRIEIESSQSVWNQRTCRELAGKEGFRVCLRMTLYRPRDLLVLLNNAFYHAFQHSRDVLNESDIEHSAIEVSENRLGDLLKEYQAIFPGIERLTRAFRDSVGIMDGVTVRSLLDFVASAPDLSAEEAQHFQILGIPEGGIHALYSVGFLGLCDGSTARFKFCHDGNQTKQDFPSDSKYLVHPCYWRALGIRSPDSGIDGAEELPPAITEIHDEYDIEISSTTPEIRKHRLGQILATLPQIPLGTDGASKFEEWCHQAISILFAAGLTNVELKPNGASVQRRDIVARNQGKTEAWRRILEDYGSRQVVFEVKNFTTLGPDEFRQMSSYLVREYGSIGFIITREDDEALRRERDLVWVKEIFHEQHKLIVKLTGNWLAKYLSKARSPQKHDAADVALGGLLDRYSRNYLSIRSNH